MVMRAQIVTVIFGADLFDHDATAGRLMKASARVPWGAGGTIALTPAQSVMLVEGIEQRLLRRI